MSENSTATAMAGHGPEASDASSADASGSGRAGEWRNKEQVDVFATQDFATMIRLQPRLLCEERHDAGDEAGDRRAADAAAAGASKWRQKEKLKTTAVALVLCLNIGVDPPDVIKISPCARLVCWVDPLSMQPAKALETIGKNLQAQYERWQPRAKYKMHLDPTVEDVKKLCLSCRRNAKNERVLFHYNGHGVPRPTVNGEIWVFNSRYTQYIPLSIYELQTWLGTPCIYVLDCSAAGVIINSFRAFMEQQQQDARMGSSGAAAMYSPFAGGGGDPLKEVIVLAACGANELLPQNPDLPADVFTACLTTPIKVALRWFCSRSLLRHDGLTKELIDRIPGRQTDRKTPLGELNWIFTAVTDTIAWNSLPRPLFQKLFRSDLLVASLFRNFLLAERIMSAASATPVSYPRLPPTAQHPMWQAWDMAAEMCLLQLPPLLADPTRTEFQPSTFFSDQLTAFELWLQHGSRDRRPPEQLPVVLQVLLSQVHRLRALVLLGRFLDMGPWAVHLALSVGIFPYVLKLLQTTSSDLRTTLVFIWCKILVLDTSCQADLVKDGGHVYFVRYLDCADGVVDLQSRAQAAFVLSVICHNFPKGQALCASAGLLGVALKWVRSLLPSLLAPGHGLLVRWLCLSIGKLCVDMNDTSAAAIVEGAPELLGGLLLTSSPELRAAAVYALGCLLHAPVDNSAAASASSGDVGTQMQQQQQAQAQAQGQAQVQAQGQAQGPSSPTPAPAPPAGGAAAAAQPNERLVADLAIATHMLKVVYDASPMVRAELAVATARFVRGHAAQFTEALVQQQLKAAAVRRNSGAGSGGGGGGGGGAAPAASRLPADPLMSTSEPGAQAAGGSMALHKVIASQRSASFSAGITTAPVGGSSSLGDSSTPGTMTPADGSLHGGTYAFPVTGTTADGAEARPAGAPGPDGATGDAQGAPSGAAAGASACTAVGGNAVYFYLVEAVLLLATDPSPKVAKVSQDILRLVRCEMVLQGGLTGGSGGATSSSAAAAGGGPGAPQAGGSGGAAPTSSAQSSGSSGGSSGMSFTQKLKQASWRSGFASSSSASTSKQSLATQSLPQTGLATARGGSPSPPPDNTLQYARPPYVLRFNGSGAAGGSGAAEYAEILQDMRTHGSNLMSDVVSGGGAAASPGPVAPAYDTTMPMPQSLIYKLSSQYFARPMLEPQASAWRQEAAATANVPWVAPADPVRRHQRLREIEAGTARCKALSAPRLREQVFSVELGAEAATALCFHPYHPLICTADPRGFLRIHNYTDATCINAFHVRNGAPLSDTATPAAGVVYLRQLNEADGPHLMAGSADGSLRVWRSYTLPGTQRLATALQTVPVQQPPHTLTSQAAFEWSPGLVALYAAGGTHPDVIHRWDMLLELCVQQFPVSGGGVGGGGGSSPAATASVERLMVAQSDVNLLLAGCSDGSARLFDVRISRGPAVVMSPLRAPLAGMAFEPNGRPGVVVAGSTSGELKFLDVRMPGVANAGPGTTPSYSVVRTVDAHSKGGVNCVVGHPCASLLASSASAAAQQVVKVWTDSGEAVGAIRAQAFSSSRQRAGAMTCMTFHPCQLLLAAAGEDSVASVYMIDNAQQAQS